MDCKNRTSNLLRRSARMFLEELDKGGRTGKVESVGDFLDRQVCGLEKHLRFNQYRLVQPFKNRSSGCLLYRCSQVLRCYVESVGIELYRSVFLVIDGQQLKELIGQVVRFDFCAGIKIILCVIFSSNFQNQGIQYRAKNLILVCAFLIAFLVKKPEITLKVIELAV